MEKNDLDWYVQMEACIFVLLLRIKVRGRIAIIINLWKSFMLYRQAELFMQSIILKENPSCILLNKEIVLQ